MKKYEFRKVKIKSLPSKIAVYSTKLISKIIVIADVEEVINDKPILLSSIGIKAPPQSFIYIRNKILENIL